MSAKFGHKVKTFRNAKNMTLQELADVVGTSKAYIWQIENRINVRPSAGLLLKLSDCFGVDPNFLLDDSLIIVPEESMEASVIDSFKRLPYEEKCIVEKIVSSLTLRRVINSSDIAMGTLSITTEA